MLGWFCVALVGTLFCLTGVGTIIGGPLILVSLFGMMCAIAGGLIESSGKAAGGLLGGLLGGVLGGGGKKKRSCPCGSGKKFKKCHGAAEPGSPPP